MAEYKLLHVNPATTYPTVEAAFARKDAFGDNDLRVYKIEECERPEPQDYVVLYKNTPRYTGDSAAAEVASRTPGYEAIQILPDE